MKKIGTTQSGNIILEMSNDEFEKFYKTGQDETLENAVQILEMIESRLHGIKPLYYNAAIRAYRNRGNFYSFLEGINDGTVAGETRNFGQKTLTVLREVFKSDIDKLV